MHPLKFVPIEIQQLSERSGAAQKGVPRRVQLLRTGKFFTHDEKGKRVDFEITRKLLDEMVSNFEGRARGIDIMIDYAHDNHREAAAWVRALETEGDGDELWAEVDWTPKGKACVDSKEYRYLSSEFTEKYRDNETGKVFGATLLGAGLTNRPVIKGMEPILALTEVPPGETTDMDLTKKIQELEGQVKTLSESQYDAADKKACADAKMSPTQMAARIKELEVELSAANQKVTDADAAKKLAEQNSEFDKLLAAGKVVEAQREPFLQGDVRKMLEKAGTVKLHEKGAPAISEPPPEPKDDEPAGKNPAQAKVWQLAEARAAEKKIDVGTAVSQVLSENKDLKKAYDAEVDKDFVPRGERGEE